MRRDSLFSSFRSSQLPPYPVVPISEVIPSRGVRALEGEGRGLSHLEVIARGAVVALASQ